jgi:hypothetical protein
MENEEVKPKRKYSPRKPKEDATTSDSEIQLVLPKTEEVAPQRMSQASAVQNLITPDAMLMKAIEIGADMDKLEKLMTLVERWQAKQAKAAFDEALSGFQSEVPPLRKSKNVGFETKDGGKVDYNYTPLGDIDEQIKTLLHKYGLSKKWKIENSGEKIIVTCIVSHVQGHQEETKMEGESDTSGKKNAIQSKGSTVTYLQRYTLIGALGLTTADGDVDGRLPGRKQPEEEEKGSIKKPNITREQLNKVVARIAKGEDLAAECRSQFTLSEKDKEAIKVADDLRLKNLNNNSDGKKE